MTNPDLIDLAMQLAEQSEASASEMAKPPLAEELVINVMDQVPPAPPEHSFAASDLQQRAITKEFRTADELAAMILSDLKQIPGCPADGVNVTVYGLSPVPNKAELLEFCSMLTQRLRARDNISAD